MVEGARPNYELVTRGLGVLQVGLVPFVHRALEARLGDHWWTDGVIPTVDYRARQYLPESGSQKDLMDRVDVAALLATLERNWSLVFRDKLTRDARTHVNELMSVRNRWGHQPSGDMSEDDAWRALDTITRLLDEVSPPTARASRALADAIRHRRTPQNSTPESVQPPTLPTLPRARDPDAADSPRVSQAGFASARRQGTVRERIVEALRLFPQGVDDDELAIRLGLSRRQHANQECRILAAEGRIRRQRVDGKIRNFLVQRDQY